MRPSCHSAVYLGRNVRHHATADGMYLLVPVVVFYVVVFLFPALWAHSYWYVIDKLRVDRIELAHKQVMHKPD